MPEGHHETESRPLDPQILLLDLLIAFGVEATPILMALTHIYPAPKGGRVLEICCGSGKLGLFYAIHGAKEAVMADIDEKSVAYAKRLRDVAAHLIFGEVGYGNFPATVRKEDIFQMSFPDNSFDFVFSEGAHEHWPEPKRREAEREMCRVLKPGGVLMVAIPNVKHPIQKQLSQSNQYHWHSMEDKETMLTIEQLTDDFVLLGLRKVGTIEIERLAMAFGLKP